MHLLLDSSGNYLVAGLAEGGRVIARAAHRSGTPESRDLSGVVDALLDSAGRPDLTAVVCGTGPGTFIGTRMAVSFANGLAAASGIGLYGVNSLAAIAAVQPAGCAVVRDARQQHVYLHFGNETEPATMLVATADLAAAVRECGAAVVVVEAARPGDEKGARRVADIERLFGGILPVEPVDQVPLEGLLACADTASPAGYIEPEYIKGFL